MKKKFTYNVSETMIVQNETIKGIALDFGTVQTGGLVIAALADYNEVSIDLYVKRHRQAEQEIFSGYLDDLLTALYAQSPTYELNKTPFGLTHKVRIDFLGGVLKLGEGDELKITLKVPSSTFTSLDALEPLSYINVETIPAVGSATAIPMIKAHAVGNGEINFDRQIGNSVHKIVAALDYTAIYTASAKAKIQNLEISAIDYNLSLSKEVLELENIHRFDDNPESPVAQMVLFWEQRTIDNVRVKFKTNIGADQDARVLVVHFFYP